MLIALALAMLPTLAHGGALARARALRPPVDRANSSAADGEAEGHAFWVANAALLEEARVEWGPLHPALYDLDSNAAEFISPALLSAVGACEAAAATGETGAVAAAEASLRALLVPAGPPGVWRLPLFTPAFCELLLEELRHHEASGIPLRRPNGMNRYGAMLEQLGLSGAIGHLSRRFLRPLGQMLYPWLISARDADEHYAFVVRYRRGEDLELAEHADASVLTLNANLGVAGFVGGSLAFRGTRGLDASPQSVPASRVDFADFSPGDAILHLGGQYHAALPIESGERVNLIVWLHGEHGVVRFAAHDAADRLDATRRWDGHREERARLSFLRAKDEV